LNWKENKNLNPETTLTERIMKFFDSLNEETDLDNDQDISSILDFKLIICFFFNFFILSTLK